MRNSLTRQQHERDYDALWDILNACFPHKGTLKRLGIDWDEIERECRPKAVDAENDLEFCRAVCSVFDRMGHFAHAGVLAPRAYKQYSKMLPEYAEEEKSDERRVFTELFKAFENPNGAAFYDEFDDSPTAGREFYWKGEAPAADEGVPAAVEPRFGEEDFTAAGALEDEKASLL